MKETGNESKPEGKGGVGNKSPPLVPPRSLLRDPGAVSGGDGKSNYVKK